MDDKVLEWFGANTWQRPAWNRDELVARKKGRSVSVVLPALNEEATVGFVVGSIVPLLGSLVDELVVVDSGSTDRTAAVAADAGATVIHRDEVLSEFSPVPGKGEVLWRGLAATEGDIVAYIDSDLVDPDPSFVPGLLGPLLTRPEIQLVKGFYRRPLRLNSENAQHGGGRVTELLVRPIICALWPELCGIVQPLGGEYAATRQFLERQRFATGYGVEIGLLLDAYLMHGLEVLGQVNLGVRKHRNRSLLDLGVMARQIFAAVEQRMDVPGTNRSITQFIQVDEEWVPHTTDVQILERPPLHNVLDPSVTLRRSS